MLVAYKQGTIFRFKKRKNQLFLRPKSLNCVLIEESMLVRIRVALKEGL